MNEVQKLNQEIAKSIQDIREAEEEVAALSNRLNGRIRFGNYVAWGFVVLGLIVGIWGTIAHFHRIEGGDLNLGDLGDYLGGSVGSVWSLAGLIFVYVAFLGQRKQLLMQQLELQNSQVEVKYTRLELQGQREEMMQQNETMKIQKFENTFFNMLQLHHQIVAEIDIIKREEFQRGDSAYSRITRKYKEVILTGRDCFHRIYEEFEEIYKLIPEETLTLDHGKDLEFERLSKAYTDCFNANQSDLSHYFRNLYNIIKLVHLSDIENKTLYFGLFRAQLSSHELLLTFYNGLSEYGYEKMKPLLEQYGLLKSIPYRDVLHQKHFNYYEESAYGGDMPWKKLETQV